MSGEPDPLYVRARAALLDTLDALEPHLDALVLVGAQAIYLHTGDADLAVAQYTTDADFSVTPGELSDSPLLGELLTARGFLPREHPGGWLSPDGIYVDVMVPEALAGPGTRGARLGPHGKRAARRAKGLEGATVDRERSIIGTLDPADDRAIEMWVAGPGALLVAKIHKIAERMDAMDRVRDKDALDVLRLLRAIETEDLARRLATLRASDVAGTVTNEAIALIPTLFGEPSAEGVLMAARAAGDQEDPDFTKTWASGDPITASFAFSGSRYAVGGMVSYAGLDATAPIEALSVNTQSGVTALNTAPITTSGPTRRLLAVFATQATGTISAGPTQGSNLWTRDTVQLSSTSGRIHQGVWEELWADWGPSGVRSATSVASANAALGGRADQLVAVEPRAAAPQQRPALNAPPRSYRPCSRLLDHRQAHRLARPLRPRKALHMTDSDNPRGF